MNSHKVYFATALTVHPMGVEEIRAMKKDTLKAGLHLFSLAETPGVSLTDRAAKWATLLDRWRYDPTPIVPFKEPPKAKKQKEKRQRPPQR